jgi:hypothetical protein
MVIRIVQHGSGKDKWDYNEIYQQPFGLGSERLIFEDV